MVMKKSLLFVVFSLWLVCGAQTLTQSVVREIYDFAVGDTFEVRCYYQNIVESRSV